MNGVIKANGTISDEAIEEFVGIVLDRRNFEGRLMARWQEGYLEQCTSVPPDAIIVFVEHIATLVTKNYLNTEHLDANGKDSLQVRSGANGSTHTIERCLAVLCLAISEFCETIQPSSLFSTLGIL